MVLTVSTLLGKLGEKFVNGISKLRVNLRKSSQAPKIESPKEASSNQSWSLNQAVFTHLIPISNRQIKSEY